jgi:hypothetical protein
MQMIDPGKSLRQSALVMRVIGWGLSVGLIALLFIYPPGFLWGVEPAAFPHLGPGHPPSPYHGLHPYLFMLGALYLAYGVLMIRGASDPMRSVALFDFGILSSVLHGLVMIPQAFYYPNEHAHLWADIPALAIVTVVLWTWHPDRVARKGDDATRA